MRCCSSSESQEISVMLCPAWTIKMALLLFSVCPLLDHHLLHLHPTHLTDLPPHLPQAQLVIVLIQGAVRGVPSVGFPGNLLSPLNVNCPGKWPSPPASRSKICLHVLPLSAPHKVECCSRTTCKLTHPLNPLMSLSLTQGFFLGLEAGQAQGLRALRV